MNKNQCIIHTRAIKNRPYTEGGSGLATYEMGSWLKQMREERGVTQKQLCKGLCTVSTLSRIERGSIVPGGYIFQALMQRMGYHPEKYYSVFLNQKDTIMWKKREALSNAIIQRKIAIAEVLLSDLQQSEGFDKGLGLQFLLNAKVALARIKGDCDHNELIRTLHESLKITIPAFEESKISGYMLSYEEIVAVNTLGIIYSDLKEYEKASRILYALKESMDNFCIDANEKAKMYPTVLYNLTKMLCKLKQYDDVISLCVLGEDFCIENNKARTIPLLMTNRAWCLIEKGYLDEARPILKQTFYFLLAIKKYKEAETVKNYYFEHFSETLT